MDYIVDMKNEMNELKKIIRKSEKFYNNRTNDLQSQIDEIKAMLSEDDEKEVFELDDDFPF